MQIKNYTNHPITLIGANSKEVVYEPLYEVRLDSQLRELDMVRDSRTNLLIPILEIIPRGYRYDQVPAYREDTYCIVSSLVAEFAQERPDFVAPSRIVRSDHTEKIARALAKPRPRKD